MAQVLTISRDLRVDSGYLESNICIDLISHGLAPVCGFLDFGFGELRPQPNFTITRILCVEMLFLCIAMRLSEARINGTKRIKALGIERVSSIWLS